MLPLQERHRAKVNARSWSGKSIKRLDYFLICCRRIFATSSSNRRFRALCEEWPRLDKFYFQRGRLSLESAALQGFITNYISIVRLRSMQIQVTNTDENRNVLMSPDSQLAETCLCTKVLQQCSAAGLAEHILGSKRSRSDSSGTIQYMFKGQ